MLDWDIFSFFSDCLLQCALSGLCPASTPEPRSSPPSSFRTIVPDNSKEIVLGHDRDHVNVSAGICLVHRTALFHNLQYEITNSAGDLQQETILSFPTTISSSPFQHFPNVLVLQQICKSTRSTDTHLREPIAGQPVALLLLQNNKSTRPTDNRSRGPTGVLPNDLHAPLPRTFLHSTDIHSHEPT